MKQVTIVKYPNRRLYNLETSKYTVMAEVLAEIRAKRLVQILEHRTRRDITREVLLDILVFREKKDPTISLEEVIDLLERAPARPGSTASSARKDESGMEPESPQP